ncbi:MAG: type II CAAX prenyl endopeptidase Rce1 family protein [Bacillota bacterium]
MGVLQAFGQKQVSVTTVWISIVATAVAFGLAHLPLTAAIVPLGPLVVARAILLNGVGGLFFGYLYWKHGLEAAIVSRFTADVMLHVILRLLAGAL